MFIVFVNLVHVLFVSIAICVQCVLVHSLGDGTSALLAQKHNCHRRVLTRQRSEGCSYGPERAWCGPAGVQVCASVCLCVCKTAHVCVCVFQRNRGHQLQRATGGLFPEWVEHVMGND